MNDKYLPTCVIFFASTPPQYGFHVQYDAITSRILPNPSKGWLGYTSEQLLVQVEDVDDLREQSITSLQPDYPTFWARVLVFHCDTLFSFCLYCRIHRVFATTICIASSCQFCFLPPILLLLKVDPISLGFTRSALCNCQSTAHYPTNTTPDGEHHWGRAHNWSRWSTSSQFDLSLWGKSLLDCILHVHSSNASPTPYQVHHQRFQKHHHHGEKCCFFLHSFPIVGVFNIVREEPGPDQQWVHVPPTMTHVLPTAHPAQRWGLIWRSFENCPFFVLCKKCCLLCPELITLSSLWCHLWHDLGTCDHGVFKGHFPGVFVKRFKIRVEWFVGENWVMSMIFYDHVLMYIPCRRLR